MRRKMNEEDKKQKIGISINEKLNELVEKEMKEKGIKKSQIIEKALKDYLLLDNENITEDQIYNRIMGILLRNDKDKYVE